NVMQKTKAVAKHPFLTAHAKVANIVTSKSIWQIRAYAHKRMSFWQEGSRTGSPSPRGRRGMICGYRSLENSSSVWTPDWARGVAPSFNRRSAVLWRTTREL